MEEYNRYSIARKFAATLVIAALLFGLVFALFLTDGVERTNCSVNGKQQYFNFATLVFEGHEYLTYDGTTTLCHKGNCTNEHCRK